MQAMPARTARDCRFAIVTSRGPSLIAPRNSCYSSVTVAACFFLNWLAKLLLWLKAGRSGLHAVFKQASKLSDTPSAESSPSNADFVEGSLSTSFVRDAMPEVAPWWDKAALNLQRCRAKSDCVFKEVCHRECYYETGIDGTPRRKCVSEMQLLKLCPGRDGWETVNSTASSETGQAPSPFHPNTSTQLPSSAEAAHPAAPMQPHLGEQWEEFMKYASDLQRQMAQESGVALEPEPATPRQRHVDPQPAPRTVMDRLLGREPAVTAGDKSKFAKLWKDYAAFGSIEEV